MALVKTLPKRRNPPTWFFVTSTEMGVYAEKCMDRAKLYTASACVSLKPEACSLPLSRHFLRGVSERQQLLLREAGQPGERTRTNRWESEFLLFKVLTLSDVSVIFPLTPTFFGTRKAVLAFCPSQDRQSSSPSPPGPRTTCRALLAPNPFLLPPEPLSWVSDLSSADEVY